MIYIIKNLTFFISNSSFSDLTSLWGKKSKNFRFWSLRKQNNIQNFISKSFGEVPLRKSVDLCTNIFAQIYEGFMYSYFFNIHLMLEVHYHPRSPAYLHISSNVESEGGFPSLTCQNTVPCLSLKRKGQ